MIYYGKHYISKKDISNVNETLKSSFLTQGPKVNLFEKKFSKIVESKYTIACSTGTSALHMACQALDLQRGENVWTTPITFIASVNSSLLCGANIDFVDINKSDWNIDIKLLKIKLEKTPKLKLPKILIVVHLGGISCDMKEIHRLSKQYNFKIIEDACHGLGGSYKNNPIGSCKYSHISTFSFHPVKNMTTGEGGAITTNSKKIFNKIKLLVHHGIVRKSKYDYDVMKISNNYRLSDISCSLGISQLDSLSNFLKHRKTISAYYEKKIKSETVQKRKESFEHQSGLHLYIIRSKKIKTLKQKKKLFKIFEKNKIILGFHYIPIYRFSIFNGKFNFKNFNESEKYFKEAFSLPIYYGLNKKDQDKVINLVNKYL